MREKIASTLGYFIDPNESFEQYFERLEKGGLFDNKALRKVLVVILDHLDKKKTK